MNHLLIHLPKALLGRFLSLVRNLGIVQSAISLISILCEVQGFKGYLTP